MNINVMPNLQKVVAAAKEANIAIMEMEFLRSAETSESLEAIRLQIDGTDDGKEYFSFLLNKDNLSSKWAS